jgi:uncharacterized peroxidase-related enzyme
MARVRSLSREDMHAHDELFATIEATYGTPPNSFYTLGRVPDLLEAAAQLSLVALRAGKVGTELKWLVANVASRAAGCSYCSAHTGYHANAAGGAPPEKVEAVWEFETSPLFDDAERAALRLARAAAVVPNEVTTAHFDDLRRHFDDDQIVEIVAPVALFGFFNRWNDTMATDLEAPQAHFAAAHLGPTGWAPKRADEPAGDDGH